MLDIRTDRLLHKINELCANGGFRIVEEGELSSCSEGEDLRGMLDYLRGRGYIDLQYAEEGVYCIRPLPEARRYEESVRETHRAETKLKRTVLLCSLFGALAGSLLGMVLAFCISLAL